MIEKDRFTASLMREIKRKIEKDRFTASLMRDKAEDREEQIYC